MPVKFISLRAVISQLDLANNWKNTYNEYVPQFIKEASTKSNWDDWESSIFQEYFEQSNNQSVSSLKQGYFTKNEKQKIKDNWAEIGPLLKQIADNQNQMQLDIYNKLAKNLRKYTSQNRVAATNRLIAGLQPHLLCTVVNVERLDWLIYFLKQNIENCPIDNQTSWYENSNMILNYFSQESEQPPREIMTLPWQVYEYFKSGKNNEPTNDMSETEIDFRETIDLLKYKKQIILQGPPGTGKTRLAKLIAQELTTPQVDIQKIKSGLVLRTQIANASGTQNYYTIESINENTVTLSSERAQNLWSPSYARIVEKMIQLENNEVPENKKHLHPYELAVAIHLREKGITITNNRDSVKIIQFHPSYDYEDFVRGITITPNPSGEGLLYDPENKTLAEIARLALENYKNSRKDEATLSHENWINEKFDEFIDDLAVQLDENGPIALTENVNITQLEENAFRYKGNIGWSNLGNRMKFTDIIQAKIDNNSTRQDIKRNLNLSRLANWHATYFQKVMELFNEFITEKGYQFTGGVGEKVEEKNFVLIIDEINRANLSTVLGELIYALEYRGEAIDSIYKMKDLDNSLILPPNLFIIGTMNTADRSVGQIDYAIRRRFAFVDVPPQDLLKELKEGFASELYNQVAKLFISNYSNEFDPKEVQLGHSYFIDKTEEGGSMEIRLKYEIKPILREYVKDGILIGSIDGQPVEEYIENLTIE